MAMIKRRGAGWYVQWKELSVSRDETGVDHRQWLTRGRTFPTEATAKAFGRDIETAAARGEHFVDKREAAISTIHSIVLAYVRAAVEAGAPLTTQRNRSSMLASFDAYAGDTRPATDLSLSLLENYARSLPGEGRQASTRHRKVLVVEQLWRWAHDRPELYPGVPVPRRFTGGSAESDKLRAPPPVYAVAAPAWADLDAMIDQLLIPWHRRIGLLMRYTGLRASQACGLDWREVDLDRAVLRVRSHVRGAKRGRARVIPMHAALVAEMAGWGVRAGLLFPRRYKAENGSARSGPYRGDALVEPFHRAWTLAKVPVEKWHIPDGDEGERAKGSPTHAIRRCIRTELLRAGVEEAIVLYLVGQSQGVTASAYVPENSPEQSPYWPRLVEAVTKIPDHRERRVIRLVEA
ncbi:MAG: site-specific integrase [Pseudomonadota bacterium]|nr:site-specific integrase [Pseudomonadota bacterium]